MTIIDCCISLKMIKNILVVLGVVDMRQLLLKVGLIWLCRNVSTTPLRQWGFRRCLPFRWTTLRGRHCRHPIAVMGVVDTFGLCHWSVLGRLPFWLVNKPPLEPSKCLASKTCYQTSPTLAPWKLEYDSKIILTPSLLDPVCSRKKVSLSRIGSYVLTFPYLSR